jgi:hypothetical protein
MKMKAQENKQTIDFCLYTYPLKLVDKDQKKHEQRRTKIVPSMKETLCPDLQYEPKFSLSACFVSRYSSPHHNCSSHGKMSVAWLAAWSSSSHANAVHVLTASVALVFDATNHGTITHGMACNQASPKLANAY